MTRLLAPLVGLLLFLPAVAAAQVDVIRGRVTNAEGLPLPGVRVTATSIPGNVTREVRTNGQGAFQIAFPNGAGDYMMGYALIGYVYRQFQLKRLADEDVLIGDARLSVVQLDTVRTIESQQQKVSRGERDTDVGGTQQVIDPASIPAEARGDLAAMAASLPGVMLVPGIDGAADGFSVYGLGADQNSVTLNGLPIGANGLPRDAGFGASVTTSPYDATRGGFSGANMDIRSIAGTNYSSRGMSLVVNAPQLQWTDAAARALGAEYTNLSLGGMASGPLTRNRTFYNTSWQFGRRLDDARTLLRTDAVGLQTAGVAPDSVARFVTILEGRGIPVAAGPVGAHRTNDDGSAMGSLDWSPSGGSSGHSFNVTVNGNWSRQRPVGLSATALSSAGGERTNWAGGVQGRHSGYLKMLLSESSAGINLSRNSGTPWVALPAGRVRVNSDLADGLTGVQSLAFGGNQGLSSSTRSTTASAQNTLSWFDDGNKHRLKFTTELQYAGSTLEQASNLLGTFTFNSLEDLEAGRPAAFSRTLTAHRRSTGSYTTAIAINDSYRRSQDVQFQYGVRVDRSGNTARPAQNPLLEERFGVRNDRVPTPVAISPRLGFSWTIGRSNDIEEYFGASRAPRAVVRGGIGLFANGGGSIPIGAALDNTGLPGGVQQVACVGPAAPVPDWQGYDADPALIPTACADGSGGSVFSNAAPSVTLLARDFRPQRSVRSNLSWSGALLDGRFNATVEGSVSLNLNQQRSFDLNFDPRPRFTLDDGRPVYVETTSIVAATGAAASRDARRDPAFSRVSELRSDLRSQSGQLSLRLSPIRRGPSRFGWSGAYTWQRVREQVTGFTSTAGDPLGIAWNRSAQGPHQVNYNLRYTFFNAVSVSWNGSFRSGSAFTPMIGGDANGDGYGNDRAYVYAPEAAPDSALAAGMSELLASSSPATRECLQRQLGAIASRNSCRGPWISTASLGITLERSRFRIPSRANVQFSLSNPLGAADLVLHGSRLRGWGQNPAVDQQLLYVRGFDAAARRYRYEVNQRFGATRPQFITLRSPVALTATIKYDLGPTRERQNLQNDLRLGRTATGRRLPESSYRMGGPQAIANPMTAILRQQDTLQLTALQADSIAAMNRRYNYRTDSIWAPAARYYAELPDVYSGDEAFARLLQARHAQLDMLLRVVPAINALLTPAQKRRLPQSVVNMLDPRYLHFIRDGFGTYTGAR